MMEVTQLWVMAPAQEIHEIVYAVYNLDQLDHYTPAQFFSIMVMICQIMIDELAFRGSFFMDEVRWNVRKAFLI